MVGDEDHGPLLDRGSDPLHDRLRALLPRLHVLPALTGNLDPWADWLVRTRFAGWSQTEIDDELATQRSIRDRVLDAARVGAGHRLVDVGAGTGLLTLGALERVQPDGTIFAVDPSADALDQIRMLATRGGVYYLIGDAAVLPLPDGSVDAAVTRSVLIHVDDLRACADELARVVAPGGRLSLFEPVNRKGRYLGDVIDWSALGDLGARIAPDTRRFVEQEDPLSRFDDDEFGALLLKAGFDDVATELETWDTSWEITPGALDARLDAVAAPGQPSLRQRWIDAYGADAASRVVAHVASLSGSRAETHAVSAHITAVRA